MTLVPTKDGLRRIDSIRAGDLVLSGDPVTGDTSLQAVLAQYSNVYEQTVYITYQGANGPETITSNMIHPFFVVFGAGEALPPVSSEGHVYDGPITGGAWVDAANLRVGNTLRGPDGELRRITSVDIKDQPLTAYNLTVEKLHTYFVTENEAASSIWVHNTCDVDFEAMARGRRSEQRILDDMGMEKNTRKVAGPEGHTIPDGLDGEVLVEVKDTKRVTDSRQARNKEAVATERGLKSILVTGEKTKVSQRAKDRYDEVERRDDLGPQE